MKTSLRQAATPQRRLRPRVNDLPHSGQHPRRRFLGLAAGAAVLPAVSRIARAQSYPARPVSVVVGFAPGGAADIITRIMCQHLSDRLGQPFIVENRAGAGGNIGLETVVRSPSDGYVLAQIGVHNSINASLYDKIGYNFVRDIAPVAGLFRSPLVLAVNPSVPAKTVPEFVAYAKSNPGRLSMSSYCTGTLSHIAGELFKMMTGVDVIHVPYRGSTPALTDLLAGQVQAAVDSVPASIEYIRVGRLRALAVTTTARLEMLPDIPTLGEFVTGYEAISWGGIGAPRNTPSEIVNKLNKEINAASPIPR
jgi:tripartite-type tricarboxylate transporter receptor subunit TctC